MVKKIGTFRRKTRHKLGRNVRKKGKTSFKSYFQAFKVGDRITLIADPSVQKGMYWPRFYGKAGIVKGKQGNCYQISILDKNKQKTLIVHPVHLKKI